MFALNVSKFLYIFSNWFEILPISTWQSYLTSMLIKFQNVLYNTDDISMKILLLYVFKYYRESLYMLYIHIYIYIYDICVCVPLSTKIDRSIFRIVYVNPPSAHFIFTFFSPLFYRNIFLSWFLLFAPVSDPPVVKQKTKIVIEKKVKWKTHKKRKHKFVCTRERERENCLRSLWILAVGAFRNPPPPELAWKCIRTLM